jgi:hypothetical protein
MCGVAILTKGIVADYCNYCNRRQEKTMPETVFFIFEFNNHFIRGGSYEEVC